MKSLGISESLWKLAFFCTSLTTSGGSPSRGICLGHVRVGRLSSPSFTKGLLYSFLSSSERLGASRNRIFSTK